MCDVRDCSTNQFLCCRWCRNAIAERFHVEAPATLIFDHPSIASLAAWLGSQLAAALGSSTAAVPDIAAQLAGIAVAARDGAQPLAAVAGVSCCFPAGTSGSAGLPSFWQQAASGVDVQTVVPLSKWDAGEWGWQFVVGLQSQHPHSCACPPN